jgi:mannose-6-phosphate isomerase-like protein (cupin superfamily)
MRVISGAGEPQPVASGEPNAYVAQMSVPDMSIGTYTIPVDGLDDQTPHTEDEVYVVTVGRGRIVTDDGEADVGPGDVIFVPAGEKHRFVDITEDLTLLVVFAPAYQSRA